MPRLDARKPELIAIAERLLAKRLGTDVAAKVAKQLTKLPLVSTADHHAVIDHPFWVNANLITALPFFDNKDPDIRYLVVFSFASVSANNASGFPRGILFHGGINGSGNLVRLPILPDKLKMGTVYGMDPVNQADVDRAKQSIAKKEEEGEITIGKGKYIQEIVHAYFEQADVLSASDLSSQITTINYRLWPTLFHRASRDSNALPIPDLIYLEIETLVAEILLAHHLEGASLLHDILFEERSKNLVLKHFNNIPGAFSVENNSGTYLFWGMDEKLRRVRLTLKDAMLVSEDQSIQVPMTPEGLRAALMSKKIFPSMALCYLTVSLYYGMKCLGGFCQVHDLTLMKEAWIKLLQERGDAEEATALEPLQTKELGGDGMVLAYFKTVQNTLVPATGIDMALESVNTSYEAYVDLSRRVTLSEAMNSLLPEMYTVLYGQNERDPALLLKPETILQQTGLEERLIGEFDRLETEEE